MSIIKKHEEMLWTVVRVKAGKSGGSGTLIYSGLNSNTGYHQSFVITNFHVIRSHYEVKKKWDPVVGMDVKKEVITPVEVDFFDYESFSRCRGTKFGTKADIVAVEPEQDMALLKLHKESMVGPVAWLFPQNKIREIHVYDKVDACGAALGHPPLTTQGEIIHLDSIIDNFEYWMSTAAIIFGNSGGAMFRYTKEREKYEFIGIPSALDVVLTGFQATPITHLGYFIPIDRIYEFLKKNFYQFIYDESWTIEQCEEARRKQKAEAEKLMMAKFGGSVSD